MERLQRDARPLRDHHWKAPMPIFPPTPRCGAEYEFKGKPGNPRRRPCIVSPYHWKIDWQMWFAAMSDYRYHPWIVISSRRCCKMTKPVFGVLLANKPLPRLAAEVRSRRVVSLSFHRFARRRRLVETRAGGPLSSPTSDETTRASGSAERSKDGWSRQWPRSS